MHTKQILLLCLLMALSVLAIDVLDRRNEIRGKADAQAKVEQLVRLIGQENNGRVSKAEFMQFMNEQFDRIASDRSGAPAPEEFSHSVLIRARDVPPAGKGK